MTALIDTSYMTAWYDEWRKNRQKQYRHATPEDRGVPVPRTGYSRVHKYANGSGVSANSRVLSHMYADEGEKGRYIRKLVRTRERALWLSEYQDEANAYEGYAPDGCGVNDWFESAPLHWDFYDDYTYWSEYECDYCKGPCEL